MRYLLKADQSPSPFAMFTAQMTDKEAVRFVKDYAKNILSKLAEDSDNEEGLVDFL